MALRKGTVGPENGPRGLWPPDQDLFVVQEIDCKKAVVLTAGQARE